MDLASALAAMHRPLSLRPLLAVICLAALAMTEPVAMADPPAPVDVVLHETPPPRRLLTVEWNPVALILGKWSANVIVVPTEHHSLVLSPFYVLTTTVPIYVTDASSTASNPFGTQLPQQTFEGFGGEIGYRYYLGHEGPRGFFAGPSLLLASMTAKAQDGSRTSFWDYGLAVDAGYQALVVDRVAISLGAGAQYLATSTSIPKQQWPAKVYANGAVLPRVLVAIGYAF
jgi:hypothetical protein